MDKKQSRTPRVKTALADRSSKKQEPRVMSAPKKGPKEAGDRWR